jgi:hypothetical protein
VAAGFFVLGVGVMGLQIQWASIEAEAFEKALHAHLPDDWSRDGILEHQITTQDDVQMCFRRRATEDVPRTTICVSGTDDVLTDAAIVPVDRGPDLTDEQRATVLSDFASRVLAPAFEDLGSGEWSLE